MRSFRSKVAARALAAVGALVMSPSSFAACDQWDLTGRWQFWQDNNFKVLFDLVQDAGGQIRGSGAYAANAGAVGSMSGVTRGSVTQGNTKGNSFYFVVDWPDRRGRYDGTVNADGTFAGTTRDLSSSAPAIAFHEFDGRKAACAPPPSSASAPSPPPPASAAGPKKVVTLGKVKEVATAIDDVDIHAGPDGKSRKLGVLKAGGTGTVVGHQAGWYQLRDLSVDLVGAAWIAEDHLKVKRVRR